MFVSALDNLQRTLLAQKRLKDIFCTLWMSIKPLCDVTFCFSAKVKGIRMISNNVCQNFSHLVTRVNIVKNINVFCVQFEV